MAQSGSTAAVAEKATHTTKAPKQKANTSTPEEQPPSSGYPALDDLLDTMAYPDQAGLYVVLRLVAKEPDLAAAIVARLTPTVEAVADDAAPTPSDTESDVMPTREWLAFLDGVLVGRAERGTEYVQPAGEVSTRKCTLDKAHGPLQAALEWLLTRSDEAKVAAVAMSVFLNGDVEHNLGQYGLYDGNLGNDLYADWKDEVDAIAARSDDGQMRSVAMLLAGLSVSR